MVTVTLEHPVLILTSPVNANIGEKFTFINIYTILLVSGAWCHEAHLTLASERSWEIETFSVGTECRVLRAFVDILTGITVSGKSGIANTSESSVKINALSILITPSVVS